MVLLRFFKALADESRLKILGILANQECSVEELATLLGLKEPTVSHHLAKLRQLDLVNMQAEGNVHLYQINLDKLQSFTQGIFTPEQMASWVKDVDKGLWEVKVLRSLIEGDLNLENPGATIRLREIPLNRKKRLVLLRWLVCQFEVGVNYTEIQVDEIIKRFHPDCTTLRSEMLVAGLMVENSGGYRRSPQSLN